MKNVCLLGATGSIGSQVIDLVEEFKDEYNLTAIAFGKNIDKALDILSKHQDVKMISCEKEEDIKTLKKLYPNIKYFSGIDGLIKVSTYPCENPVVVNSLVGSVGLVPTLEAIKNNRDVYLANKETLVIGGKIVMDLAKKYHVNIIPIDSEHSAIKQLLDYRNKDEVNKLIITASGGAFRDKTKEELKKVTKEDALKHPNWQMGNKITIDCATMMNKGFELMEAHYLFDIPLEKIVPIIHKESIIHSFVEFNDGSIYAQMASSDMHLPIWYALNGPKHEKSNNIKKLDLFSINTMHLEKVDDDKYPMLGYMKYAYNKGDIYPTILNAANEASVRLFLEDKISFLDIEKIVKKALDYKPYEVYNNKDFNVDLILEVDNIVKNDVITGKFLR